MKSHTITSEEVSEWAKNIAPSYKDYLVKEEPSEKGIYTPQTKTKKRDQFGDWKVYKNGDLDYKKGKYFICGKRLQEKDWIAHLFERGWINWNDFIPAYFQALKNRDINEITLTVFY